MHLEAIRSFCLQLPGVTEAVKWDNDLCFLIGGKMFTAQPLEGDFSLSFKCHPDVFAELIELPDITPAPYLARYYWVRMERADALAEAALKEYLQEAYRLVRIKLPKKVQASLPSA